MNFTRTVFAAAIAFAMPTGASVAQQIAEEQHRLYRNTPFTAQHLSEERPEHRDYVAEDRRPAGTAFGREIRRDHSRSLDPSSQDRPEFGAERQPQSDEEITEAIRREIQQDENLRQERLNVETENRVVYLSGWVDRPGDAERLEMIVGELQEVERIESELVVDPQYADAG